MKCFLKKIFEGIGDHDSHRYFIRYGKGLYKRRFIISVNKGKNIKIRGSYEWANDFVRFVNEIKDIRFNGRILMKDKVPGKDGKKKAGSYLYEVSEVKLEEFENPYFYLLNANSGDIVLKIKKILPKPGKDAEKIDDKFCSLDLDLKYWNAVKDIFFWDVGEFKKCIIDHELNINEIVFPEGEKDPAKVRELAKRKGKLVRNIDCDGKKSSKEYEIEA